MKRACIIFWVGFLFAPANVLAQGNGGVTLRPVDRATVRVFAIGGARPARIVSQRTGAVRLLALPGASHGTGVVVDVNGLILTAAHVTQGADVVAVIRPGETQAMPARVVFVHPDHDIAFLFAPGPFTDAVPVPPVDPPLSMSEQVSASGYPLDLRERLPAAVTGVVSRVTNAGDLQLAMGVNPGNSGGPVINAAGELVGILSKRGEPRAGVENIALVEPVAHVRDAFLRANFRLSQDAPTFDAADTAIADVAAHFIRTNEDEPIYDPAGVGLAQRASNLPRTPEEAAIIAAYAWNMTLGLLENRGSPTIGQLPPADSGNAQALMSVARGLAQRVDQSAPFVRLHYPIVRSIVVSQGRTYVPRQ